VHCVRNITLCLHCNEPVAKTDIEDHIAKQHTEVTCPHCLALLMKSELEQHVADLHTTELCPECGEEIIKKLLEDHKHSVHSTAKCQLCHKVIDETELQQHQVFYWCICPLLLLTFHVRHIFYYCQSFSNCGISVFLAKHLLCQLCVFKLLKI